MEIWVTNWELLQMVSMWSQTGVESEECTLIFLRLTNSFLARSGQRCISCIVLLYASEFR